MTEKLTKSMQKMPSVHFLVAIVKDTIFTFSYILDPGLLTFFKTFNLNLKINLKSFDQNICAQQSEDQKKKGGRLFHVAHTYISFRKKIRNFPRISFFCIYLHLGY